MIYSNLTQKLKNTLDSRGQIFVTALILVVILAGLIYLGMTILPKKNNGQNVGNVVNNINNGNVNNDNNNTSNQNQNNNNVLDLSNKDLSAFPMDILRQRDLKVLNLSYNNIKSLPADNSA